MLDCQNVVKSYGSLYAVNGVSTQLLPGHVYALLGPNGSGKSTLMKLFTGITKPDLGEIFFEGHPLNTKDKSNVAYMPTENFIFPYMTAMDAGNYYKDFFEDFNQDYYLALLQQMQLVPSMKVSRMSSGMMAKCKLCLTLARNAKLIMLDEPLNGIDLIAREKVMQTVMQSRNAGRSIVISSHLIEELELFTDYAIFMKSGQIVLQGPSEILRSRYQKPLVQLYREIYAY